MIATSRIVLVTWIFYRILIFLKPAEVIGAPLLARHANWRRQWLTALVGEANEDSRSFICFWKSGNADSFASSIADDVHNLVAKAAAHV